MFLRTIIGRLSLLPAVRSPSREERGMLIPVGKPGVVTRVADCDCMASSPSSSLLGLQVWRPGLELTLLLAEGKWDVRSRERGAGPTAQVFLAAGGGKSIGWLARTLSASRIHVCRSLSAALAISLPFGQYPVPSRSRSRSLSLSRASDRFLLPRSELCTLLHCVLFTGKGKSEREGPLDSSLSRLRRIVALSSSCFLIRRERR